MTTKDLLSALISASEKAANIARICRKNEDLFRYFKGLPVNIIVRKTTKKTFQIADSREDWKGEKLEIQVRL